MRMRQSFFWNLQFNNFHLLFYSYKLTVIFIEYNNKFSFRKIIEWKLMNSSIP